MDLKLEAQRVMAVALGKMYNSRLQRGGIRLHRSLLLSLVLRGARDIYLNVRGGPGGKAEPRAEAMELEAGEQRGPVRGSEGLQPRGSEGLQPRGSEGLQPRGSEGLQPRGSEGLQPRGSEGLQPRGSEGLQPRGSEGLQPRGSEGLQPRGEERLQPRGEERLQPRECIRCGRYPSVPAAPQRSPAETPIGTGCLCPAPEPREAGKSPGSSRSRKRRKGRDPGQPPEAVPSKRARLEEESQHRAAAPENPGICSLAAVFSGLLRPGQSEGSPGHICRDRGPSELGMWLPAIVAC